MVLVEFRPAGDPTYRDYTEDASGVDVFIAGEKVTTLMQQCRDRVVNGSDQCGGEDRIKVFHGVRRSVDGKGTYCGKTKETGGGSLILTDVQVDVLPHEPVTSSLLRAQLGDIYRASCSWDVAGPPVVGDVFAAAVINFFDALSERRRTEPCKKLIAEYDVEGGNYTLKLEKVDAGDTQIITSICAYVDGGSPGMIRVGRAFMGNLFWQESENSPADGELVCSTSVSVLQGGDYIVAYFEDVPAGSDIYLLTSCGKPFMFPFLNLTEIEELVAPTTWANTVRGYSNVTDSAEALNSPDNVYATIADGPAYLRLGYDALYSPTEVWVYHNSVGVNIDLAVGYKDGASNCIWDEELLNNEPLTASPMKLATLVDIECIQINTIGGGGAVDIDAIGLL